MDESDRLESIVESLTAEMDARYPGIIKTCPLERYIGYLNRYPKMCALDYVSHQVHRYCEVIVQRSSHTGLQMFHKLLLLTLIRRATLVLSGCTMPAGIKNLYAENFQRIVRRMESNAESPGFYLYETSHFHKELGVCSLRLIPCGARKVHINRLPRRGLVTNGPWQLARAVTMVMRDLGGFGPLYEWHTDSHDPSAMAEFNAEGWTRLFVRLAMLLKYDPFVRGAFGGSWLYDPQLKRLSPRLAYMRELVIANGGFDFCLGPCNPEGIRLATLKSDTRRSLYTEGKYMPMHFLLVWPRDALVKWSESSK